MAWTTNTNGYIFDFLPINPRSTEASREEATWRIEARYLQGKRKEKKKCSWKLQGNFQSYIY